MKSIKLNKLAKNAMKEKEMNTIKGGQHCYCACVGSSSIVANGSANWTHGYKSVGISIYNQYCFSDEMY
jgi:natural product precursor